MASVALSVERVTLRKGSDMQVIHTASENARKYALELLADGYRIASSAVVENKLARDSKPNVHYGRALRVIK